jgi:spore coat protein U-like protein
MQILRPALAFAVAAVLQGLSLSGAQAATATGQFNVTLTLQAECRLTSTSNVAFGTSGVITSPLTATGSVVVQCTNTTPFNVGLNAGNGTGATITNRLMSSGASTLPYQLFRDAGRTQNWGNTVGTDTLSGTGSGAAQSLTVYGLVPIPGTQPAPGSYSDTVQVTVTY